MDGRARLATVIVGADLVVVFLWRNARVGALGHLEDPRDEKKKEERKIKRSILTKQ